MGRKKRKKERDIHQWEAHNLVGKKQGIDKYCLSLFKVWDGWRRDIN